MILVAGGDIGHVADIVEDLGRGPLLLHLEQARPHRSHGLQRSGKDAMLNSAAISMNSFVRPVYRMSVINSFKASCTRQRQTVHRSK